jgi:branched-chain amino acid aminotransferase
MLYMADEIFFTGTAAEITPVRSVDRLPVGNGKRGPITEKIQARFFGLVEGELEDTHGWLLPVE